MEKKEYYKYSRVLFWICSYLKDRELSFLSPEKNIRMMKAHHSKFLKSHMEAFHFLEEPMNMYLSCARFRSIPTGSYNLQKRIEQQKQWNQKAENDMISYDVLFDFDSHRKIVSDGGMIREEIIPIKKIIKDVSCLASVLRDYKISHKIRFSGSGFHVVIPYHASSMLEKVNHELMDKLKYLAERLKKIFDLDTLDTSVYDTRRIMKVPFTIDVKTGNLCTPLTIQQLNRFDILKVQPKNVYFQGMPDEPYLYHKKGGFEELMADCGVIG